MLDKTLNSLRLNGFKAEYFPSGEEACAWLVRQISPGERVAFGGSLTLEQIGLRDKLEKAGADYLDYRREGTAKEKKDRARQCFFADAYFASANAITEDGFILNVDGTGNRIAATIFGPDRVYIVAGINKLCPDLEAAKNRKREIAAPLNSRRLKRNTPCVETGLCSDCQSPERICKVYAVFKRPPTDTKLTVAIIGENLGF